MNITLAGVLAYVVAQLLIGAWVARRIRTEEDYLVAGRKLGYPLAMFTIFATWFGAETCIGAAGAIYESGLSGSASYSSAPSSLCRSGDANSPRWQICSGSVIRRPSRS
jgi:Na+/proline symporter